MNAQELKQSRKYSEVSSLDLWEGLPARHFKS